VDFPEVMNVKETSEYLGVKPDTIYRYIHSETIPAFKLGGLWRFKKKVLDEWMENQSKNRKSEKRTYRKQGPGLVLEGEKNEGDEPQETIG